MKPICQVYAEGRNGHANQQQTPAEEDCSVYEVAKRRHDRDPERKFQIPTLPSMLLYVQRDVLKRASIALANPSIPNQWARSHCSADGRSPPTRAAQRFTLLPMSSCAWATIARSAPRHLTRRAGENRRPSTRQRAVMHRATSGHRRMLPIGTMNLCQPITRFERPPWIILDA